MEATVRLLLQVGKDSSPTTQLSGVHLFCAALAYFREIVKTIEREKYEDRLFELVEKGLEFSPMKDLSLTEVRPLLSPTHPEIGGNVLLKIRNQIAFHWDPGPFKSLLDHPENEVVDLWTVGGERTLDRIFAASAHAMVQFVYEVPHDGTTVEDLSEALVNAVALIGHALESAFLGVARQGIRQTCQWGQLKGGN